MQRFFIPHPTGYFPDQIIDFPDEVAHQMRAVMRMRVGEQVCVLDNLGGLYDVTLTAVSRSQVSGQVNAKRAAAGEPMVKLTLFQSMTKRDKFEWVLQKGTELGVVDFVPIVTQRSLVQELAIKSNKLARWQKIVTEAAEQSQRGKLPIVNKPISVEGAFKQSGAFDISLIACVSEKQASIASLLRQHQDIRTVALFIGPEGGFTDVEVENGRLCGLQTFTMGERVLRTETAALAATALILHELGELV